MQAWREKGDAGGRRRPWLKGGAERSGFLYLRFDTGWADVELMGYYLNGSKHIKVNSAGPDWPTCRGIGPGMARDPCQARAVGRPMGLGLDGQL
jgi:hypothetical protein